MYIYYNKYNSFVIAVMELIQIRLIVDDLVVADFAGRVLCTLLFNSITYQQGTLQTCCMWDATSM